MLKRPLKSYVGMAVILAMTAVATASAQSPNFAGQTPPGSSDHLQEMEREMERIRQESRDLGGQPSPGPSLSNVETRVNQVEENIDRLSEIMEEVGANREELDRLRREYDETDVVTLSDIPQEGAEQVAEQCVKRTCTKYGAAAAAPWVGWIMLAGDVVEYGGKLVIREVNSFRLRELVSNETAKHSEVFELIMAQYCELEEERAKVRRLKQLRERANFLFSEIAQERKRMRLSRHANLTRETDPAGDAEERALHEKYPPTPPRIEIRPADSPAPRRPTPGVSLAEPTQGAMNLSPFAGEMLSAHNRERAAVGAPPLNWNPQLAGGATAHAQNLARTGRLVHASRVGRTIERENLSQGLLGWNSRQMLASWLAEKRNFTAGTFPNVSRTGNWYDIGHYSQMIWPETTDVGCGIATGSGFNWLVCRYSPGGNKDGKTVGVPSARIAATRPC